MGYYVGLYKLPVHLKDKEIEDEHLLFTIANLEEDEHLIASTNFSMKNENRYDFEEVFNISITGDDYFKVYGIDDYHKAKQQLEKMKITDEILLERIQNFFLAIENEYKRNGQVFFYSN